MATARQLAAEALLRVEQDGAYSNIALDKKLEQYQKNAGKDGEARARSEAAFASTLFYGVLERRLTLDCCIENYAAKGLKGMSPEVLQILRVAFYQMLFMPNIPESAVVNEAVKLTRQMRRSSASGFVNGVLRSFLRDGRALPHFDDPLKELSILYSIPQWMFAEWQRDYGPETAGGASGVHENAGGAAKAEGQGTDAGGAGNAKDMAAAMSPEAMQHMMDHMILGDMLRFGQVPKEAVEQIDAQLKGIPNK